MSQVGFEPTISAGERPQTYALDRAVNGTGLVRDVEDAKSPCSEPYWIYLMSGIFVYFRLNGRLASIVTSLAYSSLISLNIFVLSIKSNLILF